MPFLKTRSPSKVGRLPYRRGAADPLFSFASFLPGIPNQVGNNILTVTPYATGNWLTSFYVWDRWQMTPKLTVSYGLRWEYFPMLTRDDRGLEVYDTATNQVLVCGFGSVPEDCGVKMSKKLFAPRFGIAYRATDT